MANCGICNGSGKDFKCNNGRVVCPQCAGSGKYFDGSTCQNCHGQGTVVHLECNGSGKCWACQGTGRRP